MLRKYSVVAIQIPIVYNKFGDHDPNGMLYVLEEKEEQIIALVNEFGLIPIDLVEPLILRANQGDKVEIKFTNKLDFPASMNLKGLDYDVKTSDGAFVGRNPNTTVPPTKSIIYEFEANTQGAFQFSDLANPLSSELGSNLHGLFGGFIVEPPGSTWTDPQTGKPVESGAIVDIHNPFLPDFREAVIVFHDEPAIKAKDGNPPLDPITGLPQSTHAINYRAEPMRNRKRLIEEGEVCEGCIGEEVHHDSWAFGDPATPIPRAYISDPMRFHVIHGGVKETHIFHLHVHQWLSEINDPHSELNDSREISPQQTITFDVLYGAGSLHGAYGDSIYHCHLYPHFGEGMWGIFRTHDVLENGEGRFYPDGRPIQPLIPLPDRPLPPEPTPERPGFPLFIPGEVGQLSPLPPLGFNRDFEPTQLEANAFDKNPVPGAPFVNPCPEDVPVRRYDIVAMEIPIIYNDAKWFDPQGRLYVLAEDEEDIRAGIKEPEPLFIRSNAGECIEIHLTNKLPETIGGNAFQTLEETPFCGAHVHFVKFDVIAADGANVGWNYLSCVAHGETGIYRWFADTELKTVFFHDHLFAQSHQHHGVFASLLVEAEGSNFKNSFTGEPLTAGTEATIENPFIPDFREYCLAVHDFVPLFDGDGNPLNPPNVPGSLDDFGVMAFNYRNEPFQIRGGDPAYVFSSWVHGDPATPVFQGYKGDPARIRLIDGAFEESHAINIHREYWHRDRRNLNSSLTQAQHIGISEAFNFEFSLEGGSHNEDFDLMYNSAGLDDLWLGCWGLIRVRGRRVPFLKPLSDRDPLEERTLPLPEKTGTPPPKAINTTNPHPENTPIRKYHIAAIQHPIIYNQYNDHDPFGMVFVPVDKINEIYTVDYNPKPLIIRGNIGDCIEVTLTNMMPETIEDHPHPEVAVEEEWPYSPRVSLHPQLVDYEILNSDGATIGFNPDQTVGPGESITYRWYLSKPVGTTNLVDYGDIRNHRHHGLFGALIVEAEGSNYRDSSTGKFTPFKEQVDIINPFIPNFRELVIIQHDGVFLVDKNNELLPKFFFNPPDSKKTEEFDEEDQGMKAFNLRSEPFFNRLKNDQDVNEVFSSLVHGDPSTPIFNLYPKDPATVRLLMPADKSRAHSFFIHNHLYKHQAEDNFTNIIGIQGEITIGRELDKKLLYGAGGFLNPSGDFMYSSGLIRWDIELGMWGIIRVHSSINRDLLTLTD
ncbi:copper oxidase [Orenia metallireducens]|uniref:Copper oxidase n=1 Tax=Orenia metallireducens TaxID=1413210 RepID=A0A1C0AAK9_9FIRM|nr:multicopper oxidase domain-containing protein [Orenia metallireducens]OCL27322.1 copper oxidase [Orenia metallireducens]